MLLPSGWFPRARSSPLAKAEKWVDAEFAALTVMCQVRARAWLWLLHPVDAGVAPGLPAAVLAGA